MDFQLLQYEPSENPIEDSGPQLRTQETGPRLFLNPEKFTPNNPEPGQLDWGFKAFVPPHSLATFLFVVWSNGVPTVEPCFSTYFKVGRSGGIDIPFCSVSCYREADSRQFSGLSESQRAQFLTGWSYQQAASNAVHWNVNLGARATAGALRAMPLYQRVETALPQSVRSGHQLRFPLLEFERPANSTSNGWSGVDLRIFLERLNVPPLRQLPNEIDLTNHIAAMGLLETVDETTRNILETPVSNGANEATKGNANTVTTELEALRAELNEARTKYTDTHPTIVSLLERIKRLEEQNRRVH